jgi:hypothetical protein
MNRTVIEKLLLLMARVGGFLGIVVGILISKGIFESNIEMCVPQAACFLLAAIFASVAFWAIIEEIVSISDRLRRLEGKNKE